MSVAVNNESAFVLPEDFLEESAQLVDYILLQEQAPLTAVVSVTFVDDEEITALNEEYRDKQGATDVLSFPCDGSATTSASAVVEEAAHDDDQSSVYWAELAAAKDAAPLLLGDVVIAPQVAAQQAAKLLDSDASCLANDSISSEIEGLDEATLAELRLLLVHGVLHLLGYDHEGCESQAEAMEAREQELLRDWAELWAGEPGIRSGSCGGGCCG